MRRFFTPIFIVIAIISISWIISSEILATTYEVGPTKTYADLETLRLSAPTWVNGDTVILYQNDNSLTDHFVIPPDVTGVTFMSDLGNDWTITQNTSAPEGGGAILMNSTATSPRTLNLANLTFNNNHVNSASQTHGNGGAIGSTTPLGTSLTISGTGDMVFTGNTATSVATSSSIVENTAAGGAIGSYDSLFTLTGDADWRFEGNQAISGDAIGTGTVLNISGHGGAVSVFGETIFNGTGSHTFINNLAQGGSASNGAVTGQSGQGGAVYSTSNLFVINNNSYLFQGNSAVGGNSTSTGNANQSGQGGALYSVADINLSGSGTWLFDGNTATGGNATNGGDTNASGIGGALLGYGLNVTGDGNYSFINNTATGGNADGTDSNASASGRGGAINNQTPLLLPGTVTWFFSGNQAIGGLATNGGTTNWSGLGGAIYANSDFDLTGGTFLNNSATTLNSNDATSGRGGAIFHTATVGGSSTFHLTSNEGNEVTFQGNMQQDGPNAVYFANRSASDHTTNATFTANGNSTLWFYDPIASQEDGMANPLNTGTVGNLILNIAKEGTGTWYQAGISNLKSESHINVNNGMFLLDRDAIFDMHHTTQTASTFHTTSSSVFGFGIGPVTDTSIHSVLRVNEFTADPGTGLYVDGISLIPHDVGTTIYPEVIVTNHTLTFPGSMSITTPFFTAFMRQNQLDGNNGDLVILRVANATDICSDLTFVDDWRFDPNLDPQTREVIDELYNTGMGNKSALDYLSTQAGVGVLNTVDARRVEATMFSRNMFDRLTAPFACCRTAASRCGTTSPCCCPQQYCRSIWGVFSQNWTEMDRSCGTAGYSYRPFAFAFGADRRCGRWMYGLAAQYAHGNVRSGDTSYTKDKMDSATLGVYGGWFGPRYYAKGNMQFGAGWNKENSRYSRFDNHTWGSYNSAVAGTSLEFGRTLRFGNCNPWEVTPHIGVDYFFITNEAFEESGGGNRRSFGSVNYNVAELPFGVRFAKLFQVRNGKTDWVRPNVDLMYVRSVADDAPVTTVGFLDSPMLPWTARGTGIGRNAFRMSAGMTGCFIENLELALRYDLDAREAYASQQLNATLAWCW